MIETERLFFAIWPDESVLQSLRQLADPVIHEFFGKPIPPENWHITLAFLGNVDQSRKQCMEKAATQIQGSHFTLILDEFGYWSPKHLLWLGARQTPTALVKLVKQLNQQLSVCDYVPETQPFKARLTLETQASLHELPPLISQPIVWTVDSFCLVRSIKHVEDTHHEIIKRWPLD